MTVFYTANVVRDREIFYLTGEVTERRWPLGAKGLGRNLKLARQLVDFATSAILDSPNFPARSRFPLQNREALNALLHRQIRFLPSEEQLPQCREQRVGNCGEMALFAQEYHPLIDVSVEYCAAYQGDHRLLFIGRDPATDPCDPDSWNEEAVICDPWAYSFYPASQYKKYLADYVENSVLEEQGLTQVRAAQGIVPVSLTVAERIERAQLPFETEEGESKTSDDLQRTEEEFLSEMPQLEEAYPAGYDRNSTSEVFQDAAAFYAACIREYCRELRTYQDCYQALLDTRFFACTTLLLQNVYTARMQLREAVIACRETAETLYQSVQRDNLHDCSAYQKITQAHAVLASA